MSLLPRTGLRCTAGPARSRCYRTRRGQTSSTRRCCTSARSGRQPCRMGWNPAPRTGSSGRPGCCRSTHRHTLGQSQGSSSNLHEHMHSKCEQVMEASQPAKHSIAQGAAGAWCSQPRTTCCTLQSTQLPAEQPYQLPASPSKHREPGAHAPPPHMVLPASANDTPAASADKTTVSYSCGIPFNNLMRTGAGLVPHDGSSSHASSLTCAT